MAGQRKRAKKVSNGVHGAGGKVRLSHVEKILLGKGAFDSFKPIGSKTEGK